MNSQLLFPSNVSILSVVQFILKFNKFKYYKLLHLLNIHDILVTLEVSKLDKSKYSNS